MKKFVVGDIHGNIRGLEQCFERSKFDFQNDTLIVIGDVADGPYPYVKDCVDLLLTVPDRNRIDIMGNHDDWLVTYIKTYRHPDLWRQGGESTRKSYIEDFGTGPVLFIPDEHQRYFLKMNKYYIDDENRCFVHGGFDKKIPMKEQDWRELMWNRSLFEKAMSCKEGKKLKIADDFTEVFVGHTTTLLWNVDEPIFAGNLVWNVDTGSGSYNGRLTFMNVDTKEIFQSDPGYDLYKKEELI